MMEPVRLGLDFSWARPDPAEMAANGITVAIAYTGAGKPRPTVDYIASLHQHGIGFVFVQESWATRAYEGYWAGVADAQYAEAQVDEVGYPEECVIYVALGDTNRSDAARHLDGIGEYARGFGDGLRRASFGGYGSREAIDRATESSPKMQWRWTVETWGANFDGYDHIVQMANLAPPIGQTDLNYIYADDVGQWPRPGVFHNEPPKEEDMANCSPIVCSEHGDGKVYAFDGIGFRHIGDPDEWTRMVGARVIAEVAVVDFTAAQMLRFVDYDAIERNAQFTAEQLQVPKPDLDEAARADIAKLREHINHLFPAKAARVAAAESAPAEGGN